MVDKRGKSEHRELGWSRRRPRPNRNLRASCRAPAAPTCPHASRHSRAWGYLGEGKGTPNLPLCGSLKTVPSSYKGPLATQMKVVDATLESSAPQ